jgi:NAD(P)-dependent dehydrogenase (short-subunit alcohol dehydrogenase family)
LAVGDQNSTELEETARLLREQYSTLNLLAAAIDVNNEASVARFIQLVVDRFGRIDFAANLSTHEPPAAGAHEVEEGDFDLAFENNQRNVCFWVCRHTNPALMPPYVSA